MRQKHPQDTRALLLEMTEEGSCLVKQAMPVVEDVDREFFRDLEDEGVFREQLLKLLSEKSTPNAT